MWEFFLSLAYFLVFLWLIHRWKFFQLPAVTRPMLMAFFGLKVLAGVSLTLVYTYYYTDRTTADVFKYFDDSAIMFDALFTAPGDYFRMVFGIGHEGPRFTSLYYTNMNSWIRTFETSVYNDSHTIIRLNAVFRLFSFGHFQVHTIFMAFISFLGQVLIFRALQPFFRGKLRLLAGGIFMLPSVLFWSSGVLKEGLLFLAIGLVVQAFFELVHDRVRVWPFLRLLPGLGILLILKFYILVAFLPAGMAYAWSHRGPSNGQYWKYPAVLIACTLLTLQVQHVVPGFHVPSVLVQKQQDFIRHAAFLNSGSQIAIPELEPTAGSLMRHAPMAAANTLLRPFPWDVNSSLMLLACGENALLLLILSLCLWFRLPWSAMHRNLFFFLMVYTIAVFILIGWTTPVTGAIVRYKVPALPFLVAGFLLVLDPDKLLKNRPRLAKMLS
ncbi:MAG: hypothetical protein AAGB22_01760 [Bacteroidota bacterium]